MDIQRAPISLDLRNALTKHTYDVVASIHEAHADLGPGMPEYLYQEALTISLREHGFAPEKEFQFHPLYHSQCMDSFLKMDIMVPLATGNVIIECKAIKELSERERYQLYGYLRGTEYPVGILVNFGTWPKAQIERYYYNKEEKTIRAF